MGVIHTRLDRGTGTALQELRYRLDLEAEDLAGNSTRVSREFRVDRTPPILELGTPLNGSWSIVVTDLWPIDNGFLFDWTIEFDPNSVEDCSGPIIGRSESGTPGHMVFSSGEQASAIQ